MVSPRRSRGRAPAGQRRMTAWDDEFINFDMASGAQANTLLVQNVADPEKRGCTLIRTMVKMTYYPSNPGAVSGQMSIFVGIGLASDDAFTAGALADPNSAADFPMTGWVYRDRHLVIDETLGGGGPGRPLTVDQDIHSQRRLDRGSLVMTFNNDFNEGVAFNVRCIGLIRCLYKLP